MYYLMIFTVICLFALLEQTTLSDKLKFYLYIISCCIVCFSAGLRYETGGDWTSYTEIFDTIEPINLLLNGDDYYFRWMSGIEVGFKYFSSCIKFIYPNVQLLFFIIALIISFFVFKAIYQYSPYPILSVLIYYGLLFFSLDMIVLRQGIATAIIFWGYKFIQERKFRNFLITCICASLFHSSVLICIPIYFIVKYRYPSRFLIGLSISFIVMFFLNIKWMTSVAVFLLSTQIDPVIAEKLILYTTNDVYAASRTISFGLLANICVFVCLFYKRKDLDSCVYFNLFLNLFIIYLFVYCCMSEFVEFGNRLKYYFMISLVILIPVIISSLQNSRIRFMGYLAACMFSFMYCNTQLLERPAAAAFNPYQNYILYKMFEYNSDGRIRLEKSDEEFNKARLN